MTNIPNSTEKNLQELSKLLGIPVKHGWKSALSKRLGVELRALSKWINRDRFPKKTIAAIEQLGYPPEKWMLIPDDRFMYGEVSSKSGEYASEAAKSGRESTIAVRGISGTVGRERRISWHPDPRKNELLHMAAFILQSDDPDITPPFEARIIEAYVSLVRTREPEPQIKKGATPT